jgi:hypothetical protein
MWRFTSVWNGLTCALALLVVWPMPVAAQQNLTVSYSLTYPPGPPPVVVGTTLLLEASATGSVTTADPALNTRWNPVTYSDQAVADLTTGLLNGSFVMRFATGDQLFGDLFEDVAQLVATGGTGPFTQRLTIRSGTGLFAGASGVLSGSGVATATGAMASGTGTVSLAPEPTSVVPLGAGLFALWGVRRQRTRPGCAGIQ